MWEAIHLPWHTGRLYSELPNGERRSNRVADPHKTNYLMATFFETIREYPTEAFLTAVFAYAVIATVMENVKEILKK
jgi:hypothetical protein